MTVPWDNPTMYLTHQTSDNQAISRFPSMHAPGGSERDKRSGRSLPTVENGSLVAVRGKLRMQICPLFIPAPL